MYVVLDLETSSKEMYSRKANHLYNHILCIGLKYQSKDVIALPQDYMPKGWLDNVDLLIIHNASFDLKFIFNNEDLLEFYKRDGRVWCTANAEFILSKQQHKFPALRDIAVNKYGRPFREKNIEKFFESGLETTDADISLLLTDVTNDVLDTEEIAKQQIKKSKENGMFNLINARMDSLLATVEIETNGIKIDREVFLKNKTQLEGQLEYYQIELNQLVEKHWVSECKQSTLEFSSDAPVQLSILLYGGVLREKVSVPDYDELGNHIKYKSGIKKGQLKYKNIEVERVYKGLGAKKKKELETKKEGIYKTDFAVLEALSKKENAAGQLASIMLSIRELQKQISTYYEGTEKFIHDVDGCIHGELCHFGYERGAGVAGAPGTGRLSAQKPNILNQPKPSQNKVREHFTARNGTWISADFSQVEPCAEAQMTGDKNFIKDIINGVDSHVKYLALQEDMPYEEVFKLCKVDCVPEWVEKRSTIKGGFTFKRAYGAGVKSLAASTGLSVDQIKELIQKEEREYPQRISFQKRNAKIVEGTGELKTVFGRVLKFKKFPAPDWMRDKGIIETYKPADIINHPIQSVGSADLTLIMIGHFWRKHAIYNRDKYLMVNTVYDSLDIDCKPEYVVLCKQHLQDALTDVKNVIWKYFKYEWVVPIKIDISEGTNWFNIG